MIAMTSLLTALRFLTILPLGRGGEVPDGGMARAMAYFPVAGFLLGLLLWLVDFMIAGILPDAVRDVIVVGLLALVTGGFHLDGFADTVDGIFGGRGDKARTLEIMKDSRIGSIGVVALALLLMLKVAALGGLEPGARGRALVVMVTLARWSQVRMSFGAAAARKEGSLAGPFLEHLRLRQFALATLAALVLTVIAGGPRAVIALVAVAVFTLAARYWFERRIGGVTGDTIGAVSETSEVVVLVVFLLSGCSVCVL